MLHCKFVFFAFYLAPFISSARSTPASHLQQHRKEKQYNVTSCAVMDILRLEKDTSDLAYFLEHDASLRGFQQFLQSAENITVFAPNNDALAREKSFDPSIVWYHILSKVISGWDNKSTQIEPTMLDNTPLELFFQKQYPMVGSGMAWCANVTSTRVGARNSVVHIIDSVLSPPQSLFSTLRAGEWTKAEALFRSGNVTENPLANVTIFVPTNEAFGTVDTSQLGVVSKLLSKIHIVQGVHYSNDWKNMTKFTTLQNTELSVWRDERVGAWLVSDPLHPATVIRADILLEGGVMHLIDQVLLETPSVSDTDVRLASNAAPSNVAYPITLLLTAAIWILAGV